MSHHSLVDQAEVMGNDHTGGGKRRQLRYSDESGVGPSHTPTRIGERFEANWLSVLIASVAVMAHLIVPVGTPTLLLYTYSCRPNPSSSNIQWAGSLEWEDRLHFLLSA